jgi:predicted TIM-barrel fold metal-dependent hydrolase
MNRPVILSLLVSMVLLWPPGQNGVGKAPTSAVQRNETKREFPDTPIEATWRPGYVRPALVDFHTHVMPSGLARLGRVMLETGVHTIVNLSGGSPGRGLEASVSMSRHFPELLHFYNPDWRTRHRSGFGAREADKLEQAVREHGFRGLKISKALGLYLSDETGARLPVDWEELDPLWARAGELGVPVAIHTGDPKAFWEPLDGSNERFEELILHPSWSFAGPEFPARERLFVERNNVIAKHPRTTFVCVHVANNPEDLEQVGAWLDAFPNMWIDTSARLPELGRHDPARVRAFFTRHRSRIVFGTDLGIGAEGLMLGSSGKETPTMADVAPFYRTHFRYFESTERDVPTPTPVQGDWSLDAIGLDESVLEDIYHRNAERLLGLRPSP